MPNLGGFNLFYCDDCKSTQSFWMTELGYRCCARCGWSDYRAKRGREARASMLARIETLERDWKQWMPLPTTLAKMDAVENRVTALERECKLIGERDVARQQRYEAEQQISAALEARTERMLHARHRAFTRGIGLDAFSTEELNAEVLRRMQEDSRRKIEELEAEAEANKKPRCGRGKRA